MKSRHYAVVLALMLSISFTLPGNGIEAADFGWTKPATSPGSPTMTNVAPKATEKSQAEKSISGGAGSGPLGACKNEQTIWDNGTSTILVQRWQEGVPNPGGVPPNGWYDIIGPDVFQTNHINVVWSGNDVLFQLFTNFPESGYTSGTVLYLPADLAFDFDLDGSWDEGVALTDHSTIPFDPYYPQPPGYGLPADTFLMGHRYSPTAWFTANDIHYYHYGYGGQYDVDDPKTPVVWMRLGSLLGNAQITWNNVSGSTAYRVDVLLTGVNTSGKWNKFNVYWGTANCANDAIAGQASKPCRDLVPGMSGLSALVAGLLIVGSGIWISIRRRAA